MAFSMVPSEWRRCSFDAGRRRSVLRHGTATPVPWKTYQAAVQMRWFLAGVDGSKTAVAHLSFG